jgi:hypothetical protein
MEENVKQRTIITVMTALILFSTATLLLAENAARSPYNPSVVYSGQFRSNAVYFHNRRNPVWYLGIKQELDVIKCREAQESFMRTGRWGGHFELDSSCGGTSEPTEWAVGNWLNFSGAKGK